MSADWNPTTYSAEQIIIHGLSNIGFTSRDAALNLTYDTQKTLQELWAIDGLISDYADDLPLTFSIGDFQTSAHWLYNLVRKDETKALIAQIHGTQPERYPPDNVFFRYEYHRSDSPLKDPTLTTAHFIRLNHSGQKDVPCLSLCRWELYETPKAIGAQHVVTASLADFALNRGKEASQISKQIGPFYKMKTAYETTEAGGSVYDKAYPHAVPFRNNLLNGLKIAVFGYEL